MWLYIPWPATSPGSVSAPEPEPSTLLCHSQFPAFVQSCTWRGKLSPSPLWSRRLRRAPWMRRLFGAMPEASQGEAFAAAWTSYLAVSRASPSASPGSAAARRMNARYGPLSAAVSSRPGPGASSSRTSAACSATAPCGEFIESFADWVSRLREDYSRRLKSVRPRSGNAFSSLRSQKNGDPESLQLFSLDQWPTPTERDHRSIHASPATIANNSRPLSEAAGLWATPRASDGDKGAASQSFSGGGSPLPAMVALWATPTVADTEGGRANRSGERAGELLIRGQALALHGHPDPLTKPPGGNSSRYGLTLNPWFVERLMGWPTGWTASDFSATGLSHWRRRMRSALLHLASPPPLPVQLSLFG